MTITKTIITSAMAFTLFTPFAVLPASAISFGNNSSQWANDGECDDPRFSGPGAADVLLGSDLGHDATDCRNLIQNGQLRFVGSQPLPTNPMGINFGDNTSQWANDWKCDDSRFEGPAAAAIFLERDLGHDANDCRRLFNEGSITLKSN